MGNGTTIGVVSPGAMGSALGAAWIGAGARVVATTAGRSPRTVEFARRAGLEVLPALEDVVAASDVVVSVVPPASATSTAREVARCAARADVAPLVVDLNATAPVTAEEIDRLLAGSGLPFVDGVISGGTPRPERPATIYLSGERAGDLAVLATDGVEVSVVGTRVGAASAVKMCTASIYKGTAGLLLHAAVLADSHGVLDLVLADLRRRLPHALGDPPSTVTTAAGKAARFVGEMREIARAQEEAGLPGDLFHAMAGVWKAVAERQADLAPEGIDLGAMTLDELVRALSGPPRRA